MGEVTIFSGQLPIWVSILFLVVIQIPIVLKSALAKKYAKPQNGSAYSAILIFYLLYFIVVGYASIQGVFLEISLPPKIVLCTTLPLLLFLVGFVFHTRGFKNVLAAVPLSVLVRLHIFRLIGSFFLILFFFDQLPKPFALFAGIGDIVTALSCLFVAASIAANKRYARKLTFAWNTFGLLDILITSALAILFTKFSIDNGTLGVEILAVFPFCYIPAFAPATIIFLHLGIYRKLLAKK